MLTSGQHFMLCGDLNWREAASDWIENGAIVLQFDTARFNRYPCHCCCTGLATRNNDAGFVWHSKEFPTSFSDHPVVTRCVWSTCDMLSSASLCATDVQSTCRPFIKTSPLRDFNCSAKVFRVRQSFENRETWCILDTHIAAARACLSDRLEQLSLACLPRYFGELVLPSDRTSVLSNVVEPVTDKLRAKPSRSRDWTTSPSGLETRR